MQKILLTGFILYLVAAVSPLAFADGSLSSSAPTNPAQTVVLRDGTMLHGSLTSINGDTYSIQTPSMGTVTVKVTDIVSITAANAPSSPGLSQPSSLPMTNTPSMPTLSGNNLGQMQAMSQEFLKDPSISATAQDIMNDKELMNLLQDKDLFAVVTTSDPQEIQKNPTVQKLLQNPKIQNMMNQIKQKMGPSADTLSNPSLTTSGTIAH